MIDKERQEISVGMITEALPNAFFRVKLKEAEVLAYLSGKMRLHRIKVMIGDLVEVVIDPYGGKGRIVRRLDNRKANLNN
ncbi:MAG: Translation initiation factor IF-1 [Parcubacteria group bacterium GW2011_GWB1_35_5]|uniref:Translation initiation factor IF-1 n=2 Tax=Candidatus Zambryskiibacteriota TaxID=1817925 RepID=A0A2H0R0N1_9BACT|nr:MAG: Translation initiation factor IF-1 [Parcubacteria group bacterium GW2011_GWC1_34_10]KKP80842.1 MAG: Translation initiation factor IF-1 [Parcubacteria group bacterium GW2011_GWB1_35_5]OHA87245.1 MAG: translation initiation factor IF-1 [Candidatus Zambryskibacteria bacterium RIFCSPHIGHO2_01_FULL_35_32]OHB02007.1 MAG: translation initiation factor IF-1 [Candidatus Zambryskibacteria bacterium RIFCSPLOWO2_01_FULL_35_19]PIR40060.1 MAG: translation initiation factor IF-1 [Candidatus Zambryskib